MKNIVIVGGSTGIGSELAQILSVANNVLVLARNEAKLSALKTLCGNKIEIQRLDLCDSAIKNNLTAIVKQQFDHVDILINTAGYLVNKPFLELTREDIELTYSTNITGIVEACQAIVPFMSKKGGHIVNIGSMGGFQGSSKFPGLSIYSSSKSAVAGLSECLAEELKEYNIQVNCLALGAAQTDMLAKAFPGYEAPLSAKKMAEYIANFSLSANQWINGKVIPVAISTP
ncbi:SDR family NAD(P)-dependent oxidoreductase [Crocinitomix catalasitica]|uniref:SDR family NAD(P)-dependent oxidoreductase n=1 Tax=Crocinitomix catalasitica TaxID=184607 RepID=UPI000488D0BF|nr:SDR family oxidoreductase [Crocinitomix catalasitica]